MDNNIYENVNVTEENVQGNSAQANNANGLGSGYTPANGCMDSYSRRYQSYDYRAVYNAPAVSKKSKKGGAKKFFGTIGLAVCFGVFAFGSFLGSAFLAKQIFGDNVFGSTGSTANTYVQNSTPSSLVIAATKTTDEATSDSNVVADVVSKNISCTVCINCTFVTYQSIFGQKQEYVSTGSGTGFVVGSNETDLLIATNNHVVNGARDITVILADGSEVTASVRAAAKDYDLAVVSVPLESLSDENLASISVAKLGSSDDTRVGQMVVAIGNALGYGQSVTVGYLSAKDREVTVEGVTMKLLQTDAAINGGNSGGPLFNIDGEVVGINCAKYSDTSVEGMCFAIPISVAIPILEDLMTREVVTEAEQGWLGVKIVTVPEEYILLQGYPEGIYINEVVEGGGAYVSGILQYDIITEVNGVKVKTSEELKSMVNSYKYGTVIQVTLSRWNSDAEVWESMTLDVTLTKKPASFE